MLSLFISIYWLWVVFIEFQRFFQLRIIVDIRDNMRLPVNFNTISRLPDFTDLHFRVTFIAAFILNVDTLLTNLTFSWNLYQSILRIQSVLIAFTLFILRFRALLHSLVNFLRIFMQSTAVSAVSNQLATFTYFELSSAW
jgi:hypothetical protein